GDSIYIASGGEGMLIDCGESGDADSVISYLDNMGVTKIDYVVGTHPHSDHMGGMSKIVEHFDIGEMIIPHIDESDTPTTKYFEKFLNTCAEKGLSLTEAELGREIEVGDAEFEIIAPNSQDYSNVNNYSVSFIMHHGDNSFIFTGDAEKLAENEMIESGRLEDIDVYKAGHHGSDTSSSEDFLNIIKPDYAVISCGEGNSYGHPNDITIANLSKFTDKIYRTDLCGTVVFESDGKELTVKTERT
ncbi:MAG: MBL fold metallo-hydrolase, partial [Ruminococcus sp.]|nr:MBL fold metallo-hydrolase [Ruminococcus sp.]